MKSIQKMEYTDSIKTRPGWVRDRVHGHIINDTSTIMHYICREDLHMIVLGVCGLTAII